MKYHEVLKTQNELSNAIDETIGVDKQDKNINSIVKLLALKSPAQIPDLKGTQDSLAFDVIQTEMRSLRRQMENLMKIISSQEISSQELLSPFKINIKTDEGLIKRKLIKLENEFLELSLLTDEKMKSSKLTSLLNRVNILKDDMGLIFPPWEELPQQVELLRKTILQQLEKQ